MEQITQVGQEIFKYVMVAGYWVTLVSGGQHIFSCIAKKDAQGAIRSALTFGAAFGSFYLLKLILDMVQGAFA